MDVDAHHGINYGVSVGGKAPWPGAEGAQKMAVQYDLDWDRFIRMFVERVTRPVPTRIGAARAMAKRPRIAVVGSANVDLTTFTDEFPRPGETIFGDQLRPRLRRQGRQPGGGGAPVRRRRLHGRARRERPVRAGHDQELRDARASTPSTSRSWTASRAAWRRSSSRSPARTASSWSRAPTIGCCRPTWTRPPRCCEQADCIVLQFEIPLADRLPHHPLRPCSTASSAS